MVMPGPSLQHNTQSAESDGKNEYTLTEKNFKDLVQSSPDDICVYVDEKIVFANTTGLKLFRAKTPEDLIGRNIWDLIPEKSHQRLKKAVDLIIDRKSVV